MPRTHISAPLKGAEDGHGARCGQGVGPRHARHAHRQEAAARGCAWLRSRRQAAPPLPSAVRRDCEKASGRRASHRIDS